LPQRIIDASQKSSLLFVLSNFEPNLDQRDTAVDDVLFDFWAKIQKSPVLRLGRKIHDIFDAGAIVPTPVEDNDFACRGKLPDVTLHEHLALFPIGGSRKGYDAEDTGTDALSDRFDGPPLSSSIAAFERDDDFQSFVLYPILQSTKVNLKLAQLLFVVLALHFRAIATVDHWLLLLHRKVTLSEDGGRFGTL
jgi:hypothetical protein